jgi:hypothetical protein
MDRRSFLKIAAAAPLTGPGVSIAYSDAPAAEYGKLLLLIGSRAVTMV